MKKPGVYEFPMGINLKELIYDHCGGITGDRKLKAVIPGGASAPMLTAGRDRPPAQLRRASMKAGSMLGSAGIIVLDDTVCIVDAVWRLAKFFAHESCGQCTPCREGTNWLESILDRLERGEGRQQDADLLLDMSDNIGGKSLCALGDAAIGPVISSVQEVPRRVPAPRRAQELSARARSGIAGWTCPSARTDRRDSTACVGRGTAERSATPAAWRDSRRIKSMSGQVADANALDLHAWTSAERNISCQSWSANM